MLNVLVLKRLSGYLGIMPLYECELWAFGRWNFTGIEVATFPLTEKCAVPNVTVASKLISRARTAKPLILSMTNEVSDARWAVRLMVPGVATRIRSNNETVERSDGAQLSAYTQAVIALRLEAGANGYAAGACNSGADLGGLLQC
jgi:hypothetical protein